MRIRWCPRGLRGQYPHPKFEAVGNRILGVVLSLLVGSPTFAQITDAEKEILARLDASRVAALTERLSEEIAQNPSGAGFGSAIAGSPEEKSLADFIERELRLLGLEVWRERFPVRRFEYGEVELTVGGDKIPAITLHSGGGTWGSRDGVSYFRGNADQGKTLRTELVGAGRGFIDDYGGRPSVVGKAVLVQWTLWPGFAILEAADRGAAAILFYDYPGQSIDDALKQNTVIYHDPIPTLSIPKAQAAELLQKMPNGSLTVELSNRIDVSHGFSENVLASVTGTDFPDEWISVTAHHDRWFRGAQDDAVGVAVMLELARLLSEHHQPRRSLLFASFGSEETGGVDVQYDWLTGSHAFVRAHPEIVGRLAHGFNVDGAGWSSPNGYLYATLDGLAFQRKLLADLGLADRVTLRPGVADWVDAWTLGAIGGGAVSYLLWFESHSTYAGSESFSPYYHTQFDRFRLEWYGNLEHDLRLGALGILRADGATVLPIYLSDVADWVEEELASDRSRLVGTGQPTGVLFEPARRAATRFGDRARNLESSFRMGRSTHEASALNKHLMRIRRELMPWLLSLSSEGAVLKTSRYAGDIVALNAARQAVREGDANRAARALEDVGSMGWGRLLSTGAYLTERRLEYSSADWSREYDQRPHSIPPDVHALYRSLASGTPHPSTVDRLSAMETEMAGHLQEALFIVEQKLDQASAVVQELSGEPQ